MTVVAVLALSPLMMTCTCGRVPVDDVAAEAFRNRPGRLGPRCRSSRRSASAGVDVGHAIEVAGVDERRDQRAALRRTVAVLDGQRDVPDVEVERVAVEQQEERRHEHEDQQRPPIARDLPQLLAVDGERLHHARPPARLRSTTSRNTSSSDGATGVDARPRRCPRPQARAIDIAASTPSSAQHGVNGGAEQARLLDLRHAVEQRASRRPDRGCGLRGSGDPANTCFTSRGRADRGQAAGVDQRDAMAALGLVEVVGGDEDRDAGLREHVDQPPELPPRQRIDAAGRLVEEEDRRLVQDRAAERQPLAPAAGEIARQRRLPAGETGHLDDEPAPLARAARRRARRRRRRSGCSDRRSAARRARTAATCSRCAA